MKNNLIIALTALLALSASQALQSQSITHTIIRGRVLDDSTGAPLRLANVFVSNSTIGTVSDSLGRFEIKNAPLGNQKIVASLVGYASQTIQIHLTDSSATSLEFRLKPHVVEIQGVEVQAKEPEGWKENLGRFLKEFIGSGPYAGECKVLNPEVLDFSVGKSGLLKATASIPLEIENRALGYHVRLFLDHFVLIPDPNTPVPASAGTSKERWMGGQMYLDRFRPDPTISKGPPTTMEFVCRTHFTPLAPSADSEQNRWSENRRNSYSGSLRHFLASLASHRSESEGFEVYELCHTKNPDYPVVTFNVNPDTLLTPGDFTFERKLSFQNALQITYRRDDALWTSFLRLSRPPAVIYINGVAAVPLSLTTYGYWASQRVADMLPTDYVPDD